MTPLNSEGGKGVGRLRGRSTLSSLFSSLPWGEGRREGWGGGRGGSSRGLVKGGWRGVGVHLNTMLYNIKRILLYITCFEWYPYTTLKSK